VNKYWTIDRVIILLVSLSVIALIAINFYTSYSHIYLLDLKYGGQIDPTGARLTPVGFDLLLLAFAGLNLFLARKGRYVTKANGKRKLEFRWPRWVLLAGVAGTVAANGAYGYWWGWTGCTLAMGSAVLLFFAVEGGMLMFRVAAEDAAKAVPAGPTAGPSVETMERILANLPQEGTPAPRPFASVQPDFPPAPVQANPEAWQGLSGIGLTSGAGRR
jgi:hypothetical protein